MSRYVGNLDLDQLRVTAGDRLLDVGCGEGIFARRLAAAGMHVTGVEPVAELRAAVLTAAEKEGVAARVDVVDGSAERLPVEDRSVAGVVLTEVLEHVENPDVVLAEIRRVLRPEGVLCASVPTHVSERLFSILHPRYLENATHVRIFERQSLLATINRAGLRVARLEGRNFQSSVSWLFHALLRSDADHAGRIEQHQWVDRTLAVMWGGLGRFRLREPLVRLGNRVFPKSWYVYAERPPD